MFKIDLFVVETPDDLGTIYAIELKFEQCLKTANDLHLFKVEICDESLNYEFFYDKFVSVQEIEQRFVKMILLEKSADIF